MTMLFAPGRMSAGPCGHPGAGWRRTVSASAMPARSAPSARAFSLTSRAFKLRSGRGEAPCSRPEDSADKGSESDITLDIAPSVYLETAPDSIRDGRFYGSHKAAVRQGLTAGGQRRPLASVARLARGFPGAHAAREGDVKEQQPAPNGLSSVRRSRSIATEVAQSRRLRRWPGRRRSRTLGGDTEVGEDLPYHRGTLDGRKQAQPATALGAGKHVDLEGASLILHLPQ